MALHLKMVYSSMIQLHRFYNYKLRTMKYCTAIVALLFLIGCKKTDSVVAVSKEEVDTPVQWLNWEGKSDMPHIVLVSGDEEYRSEEALPQMAKILSERHGFNCTVLFAQEPGHPGIVDPNCVTNIPGLHQLAGADMMILFTRFRALPDEQMKHVDQFLKDGKPLIAMRTSTHAFMFKDTTIESNYKHYGNYYNGDKQDWKDGFGRLVVGEHWISHHGKHGDQSTRGIFAPGAETHALLNGIVNGDIWGPTDVYGVRLPLPGDAMPIVLGQVVDRDGERDDSDVRLGMRPSDTQLPGMAEGKRGAPDYDQNDPMMPVAWTKSYQIPGGKKGKCFSTTMGASTDLLNEGMRRLLVNAVFWSLDKEVPAKADVAIVGSYNPSKFAFHDDEHWDNKNIVIATLK